MKHNVTRGIKQPQRLRSAKLESVQNKCSVNLLGINLIIYIEQEGSFSLPIYLVYIVREGTSVFQSILFYPLSGSSGTEYTSWLRVLSSVQKVAGTSSSRIGGVVVRERP